MIFSKREWKSNTRNFTLLIYPIIKIPRPNVLIDQKYRVCFENNFKPVKIRLKTRQYNFSFVTYIVPKKRSTTITIRINFTKTPVRLDWTRTSKPTIDIPHRCKVALQNCFLIAQRLRTLSPTSVWCRVALLIVLSLSLELAVPKYPNC